MVIETASFCLWWIITNLKFKCSTCSMRKFSVMHTGIRAVKSNVTNDRKSAPTLVEVIMEALQHHGCTRGTKTEIFAKMMRPFSKCDESLRSDVNRDAKLCLSSTHLALESFFCRSTSSYETKVPSEIRTCLHT